VRPLDKWVGGRVAQEGCGGGFVGHYRLAALFPEGLTEEVQWALGALVLAVDGWVYWRVWRRARRQAQ